jgi:hypothetical protein
MSAKLDSLGKPIVDEGFGWVYVQILKTDPAKTDNDITVVTHEPMFSGGGKTCVKLSARQIIMDGGSGKPPALKNKSAAKATATTTSTASKK